MHTGKYNLIQVVCREKLSGTYTNSRYDVYPTEAIPQRPLQCDISDIRHYWVITIVATY